MNRDEPCRLVCRSGVYAGVVALLLTLGSAANAATVTFAFSGVVANYSPNLAGDVATGMPVTGRYSFDSEAPDTDPSELGRYVLTSFEIALGGLMWSSQSGGIITGRPPAYGDQYYAGATEFDGPRVGPGDQFALVGAYLLFYNPFDPLADDALPLTPPNLPFFGAGFDFATEGGDLGYAVFNDVHLEVVPEPGTLLLAGLGIAAIGAGRSRTR